MDIESLSLIGGWRRLSWEPMATVVWPWPYPEVTGPHDTGTMRPYLPDTNPMPPSPPQQGWECPRCRRINAPSMLQCTCTPDSD